MHDEEGETFESEEVEYDPSKVPPAIQKKLVEAERSNSRIGLIFGLVMVILGVGLVIYGAAGATDLEIKSAAETIKVTKAAPGVILIVLGAAVILYTRFKVKAVTKK